MPVPRVLIGPDGVRLSRPGVDARYPPTLTEEHLALDWSWPRVERLMASGIVRGNSITPGTTFFDFPFASVGQQPFASVVPLIKGTTQHLDEQIYFSHTQSHVINGVISIFYFYNSTFRWVTTPTVVRVYARTLQGGGGAPTPGVLSNYDWAIMVFRPF